jgi:hypothetical protein
MLICRHVGSGPASGIGLLVSADNVCLALKTLGCFLKHNWFHQPLKYFPNFKMNFRLKMVIRPKHVAVTK